MFGYESGQISGKLSIHVYQYEYKLTSIIGFLQMSDFLKRFGQNGEFSSVRQGTIVALLCAGTLVGCLGSGWICDKIGRRYTVSASAFFYIIGVIIEITSSTVWVQFAMGRFTAGLGIGALSTSVPMYQSESVPKKIRSVVVGSYQLAITLGIWTAYMVSLFHPSSFPSVPNNYPGQLGYRSHLFQLSTMANSQWSVCTLGYHPRNFHSFSPGVPSFRIWSRKNQGSAQNTGPARWSRSPRPAHRC